MNCLPTAFGFYARIIIDKDKDTCTPQTAVRYEPYDRGGEVIKTHRARIGNSVSYMSHPEKVM